MQIVYVQGFLGDYLILTKIQIVLKLHPGIHSLVLFLLVQVCLVLFSRYALCIYMHATNWYVVFDMYTACQCHGHATSCIYNEELGESICTDCRHHTTGYHCLVCQPGYRRRPDKDISHPLTCVGKIRVANIVFFI